jgi:urea transport system permease protein
MPHIFLRAFVMVVVLFFSATAWSKADPAQLKTLTLGTNNEKIAVLRDMTVAADADSLPLLSAMASDTLYVVDTEPPRFLIADERGIVDAFSRETLTALPDDAQGVVVNNRVRAALSFTMAALQLNANDATQRRAAIDTIRQQPTPDLLPLLDAAYARETVSSVKTRIAVTRAMIRLNDADRAVQLDAVRTLGTTSDPANLKLLEPLRTSPDAELARAAKAAMSDINGRLAQGEFFGEVFTGLSLASILLLAALGLAVIYGLMGVINMAHGEFIMIGAYAAYVTQTLFRQFAPEWFGAYPIVALPICFVTAGLCGIALERLVIRHLYGRPLETLLATWGISLILIQTARSIFGAQNVAVENPSWLSGGIEIYSNLILPYNRLAILVLAALVLVGVALLLSKTRLGLTVRAVTQNRPMARALGVATGRVDALTFGLGAGLAGLAGCALSQVGNVGPELGQGYIVDSFMVVVLGGVGQIWGTVWAALGLGVLSKFLEGFAGAVLAKIFILIAVIVFIQKRPQGIFALKGRFADG